MKVLALLSLVFLSSLMAGCGQNRWGSTPAYTASERDQQIARNWNYEGGQMVDDWDSFWLLRPASTLTIWNVR